ncbi:hypothetical protein N2152v2_007688 [Parachlorella kessleri]
MVKWSKLFKGKSSTETAAVQQPSASCTAKVQVAKGKLDDAEELLVKKRDLLERQIAQQLEKARQATRDKNKTAALAALKKKKLYEAQLEQIECSILRVDEQQLMLENSQTTMMTLATLGDAAKAAKVLSAELSVEQVDQLRDQLDEQHDEMRQITDMLGQPMGAVGDFDDVEAELEGLEQDLADAELASLDPVPSKIAAVHVGPAAVRPAAAAAAKTQEELELEELEQELLAA